MIKILRQDLTGYKLCNYGNNMEEFKSPCQLKCNPNFYVTSMQNP